MDKITIFLILYSVSTLFQEPQETPLCILNLRSALLSIAICFVLLFPFPKWIKFPEVPDEGVFKVSAEKEATFKGKFIGKFISETSVPSSSAFRIYIGVLSMKQFIVP